MKTTLSALSTLAGTLALTSLVSAQALTGLSFTGSSDGDVFPVACGVATKNLGPHALLDAPGDLH